MRTPTLSPPILLAPAGSPEAAAAALAAGADAVYVGLKGWSRGGGRGELTPEELRGVLAEAARHGRTVQVACNTIPKPAERAFLLERVEEVATWGVAGVIVNDVGLLTAIRRRLPALPVTASIGCGALSWADAAFYEAAGASCLVFPAVLEPEEVAVIRRHARLQIEVMIHMVEEFILLGRCLMPSYLRLQPRAHPDAPGDGRRLLGSMKRGGVGICPRVCQQPWRLEKDGEVWGDGIFPGRQLSRLADLPAYLAAGVDVLKLQGRSLPAEAVYALTRRYREGLDAALRGDPVAAAPAPLPAHWTAVGR
ncbi:MAG TPA: peptidase U32 family protein [Candidatus Methylomirabilis sp.]|nr:peptidase U32 family protein [Candidatus Methylomirabilis sp.]